VGEDRSGGFFSEAFYSAPLRIYDVKKTENDDRRDDEKFSLILPPAFAPAYFGLRCCEQTMLVSALSWLFNDSICFADL
jgi:hypothetical protein